MGKISHCVDIMYCEHFGMQLFLHNEASVFSKSNYCLDCQIRKLHGFYQKLSFGGDSSLMVIICVDALESVLLLLSHYYSKFKYIFWDVGILKNFWSFQVC